MAAALDTFPQFTPELNSPATHAALVTPSDSADLATVSRYIAISAAGTLKVTTMGGDTVTIPSGAIAAGQLVPLRVSRVWNTGTSATGIVAFW